MDSNHTLRIDTPPEVAQGANGEPAYVIFKTRYKGKYQKAFTRVGQLNSEVKQLKTDNMSEAEQDEALILIDQLNHSIEAVYAAFAHIVLDWNWLDEETGAPLPKPNENPAVFSDELFDEQVAWIREHINKLTRYRATEGNAPSGNDSSPG